MATKKSSVKKTPSKKPTAKPVEKLMPLLPVLEEEFYIVVNEALTSALEGMNNTEKAEIAILKSDFKGLVFALNSEDSNTSLDLTIAHSEAYMEIGLQGYLESVRVLVPDKVAAIEKRILGDLRASEISNAGGMTYNEAFDLFGDKALEGIDLIYDFNRQEGELGVETIKTLRNLFKK